MRLWGSLGCFPGSLPLFPTLPHAQHVTVTASQRVTHLLLEKVVDQEGGSLQQVCSLGRDGVAFVSHLGRLLLEFLQLSSELEETFCQQGKAIEQQMTGVCPHSVTELV